jgi:hypothetical protein
MQSILHKTNFLSENKLTDIAKRRSISPSEIITFEECPHKWKLIYVDRLSKFETNIDFLFGKAAHEAIQNAFIDKNIERVQEFYKLFSDYIEKEKDNLKKKDFDKIDELVLDAHSIFDNFDISELVDLKEVEDVAVEEKLVETINPRWVFSGRLDLIFRVENKIKIWDIKTAKSAWKIDKKGNIAILSQPILYKVFWTKKYNFEKIRDVSTAFLILKKKARENEHIELFPVSSGPIAIQRCVNNMNYSINCIEKQKFLKSFNKYVCKWCEFNNTDHCVGEKSF